MREKELAELLHNRFCHRDHVENCAWEYESNYTGSLWGQSEHKLWLQKAKRLIKLSTLNVNELIITLRAVKSIENIIY